MESKIIIPKEDKIEEIQQMESFMIVISKIIKRKYTMINKFYYNKNLIINIIFNKKGNKIEISHISCASDM